MIVKRIVQLSALLSISSCLCSAAPNAAFALPSAEVTAKESKEETKTSNRQGLPGRRISGGTRSDSVFLSEAARLTAITVPSALSITTSAYPELLFYLPEMKAENSAEFVLLNAAGEVIYEETIVTEPSSALISIDTADAQESAPIRFDEEYEWYFSIIPDAEDRSHDVVVHGSILRVDTNEWLSQQQMDAQLAAQIASADPLMQAQVYQEANLWHDAALVLNELRQSHPESEAIAAEWTQLLANAQLDSIAELPTNKTSKH